MLITKLIQAANADDPEEIKSILAVLRNSRAEFASVISEAVHRGESACVKLLLDTGLMESEFMDIFSVLFMDAVCGGHTDVSRTLLSYDDRAIRTRLPSGRSCLHEAARLGSLDLCKMIVSAGTSADVQDHARITPIMLAAAGNHPDVIQFLFREGALVNRRDKYGDSALSKAVDKRHLEAVRMLITLGADCNIRTQGKSSNTLLHLAAKRDDPDVLQELLEDGVKYTGQQNMLGQTAFDVSLMLGKPRCIQLFLRHGADPNRLHRDWTPLMRAAWRRMPSVVTDLIGSGSDVNTSTAREGTALHKAIEVQCPESVGILLDAGADVNISTRGGITPLHCAALQDPTKTNHGIMLQLLRRGADVNAESAEGRNASRLAMTDFSLPTTRILQKSGASPKYIRSVVTHCCEHLDTLVSFLCGNDFRKATNYDPSVIEDSIQHLYNSTRNASRLGDICSVFIRRCLRAEIPAKSRLLPLPAYLRDKINFSDVEAMRDLFHDNT